MIEIKKNTSNFFDRGEYLMTVLHHNHLYHVTINHKFGRTKAKYDCFGEVNGEDRLMGYVQKNFSTEDIIFIK